MDGSGKKIAIPTRGNMVDNHFGHCEMYTVITADDNSNITNKEILPSPQGCGCKSDIAAVLQQIGVRVMLAGGIGEGAINVLKSHGIDVIRGCSGDVDTIAKQYLKGKLVDSGISCFQHEYHHGEGHSCNH
jgi:predicted Fe-Mo cluster-binding NifX family protein